jgi:hypothetical protein
LYALQAQFLLDSHRAMAGMNQRMVEYGLLDLGGDPVGVRSPRAGKAVDQPLGAISLEVASDLVKLLAGIAHHLAVAADVGEVCSQFQQRELAACYLVLGGHDRLPFGSIVAQTSPFLVH